MKYFRLGNVTVNYELCFNRNTTRQQQQSATLLPSKTTPTRFLRLPNNIKIIERKKKEKKKELPLWGRLHKWHNRLESSVPGVNQVGTRCQSTGRVSATEVTAGGLSVGLRGVTEMRTNCCLWWEPSTCSTFHFFNHLVLHLFPTSVFTTLHLSTFQSCGVGKLQDQIKVPFYERVCLSYSSPTKETVGWIPACRLTSVSLCFFKLIQYAKVQQAGKM